MSTVIFWFRNDLRLHDQPALAQRWPAAPPTCCPWCACRTPTLPRPGALPAWAAPPRLAAAALRDLRLAHAAGGCPLLMCHGPARHRVARPGRRRGRQRRGVRRHCRPLRAGRCRRPARAGPAGAYGVAQQPAPTRAHALFCAAACPACSPLFARRWSVPASAPQRLCPAHTLLPPWPEGVPAACLRRARTHGRAAFAGTPPGPMRARPSPTAMPAAGWRRGGRPGPPGAVPGTQAAPQLQGTRNGLTGLDYSSKFSPWLATGALSARQALPQLKAFGATTAPTTAATGCGSSCCGATTFGCCTCSTAARCTAPRGWAPLRHPARPGGALRAGAGPDRPAAGRRRHARAGRHRLAEQPLRQVVASYLIHDLRVRLARGRRVVRGATGGLRRLQQPGQLALHRRARHRPARRPPLRPRRSRPATTIPTALPQALWSTP
jgi:deoxyribodipyrimidine photo-lyase